MNNMTLKLLCSDLVDNLPRLGSYDYPWQVLQDIEDIIKAHIRTLDSGYKVERGIAVHISAKVDPSATLLPPVVISPHASVGPHALLRGGVYVGAGTHIGQGVEVKHSLIGDKTALAHFNYVGDSLVGSNSNLEAGSVVANHWNERDDKTISVVWQGVVLKTNLIKFGACIGDGSKLGANAVTSPGTILQPCSIVRRLGLVEQINPHAS